MTTSFPRHPDTLNQQSCPTPLTAGLEAALSRNRFKTLFWFALAGAILSKGMALLPGFALDDYAAIHTDVSVNWYISQGRFTQALVQLAMSGLGLRSPEIHWPVILLFLPTIAICIALAIGIVTAGRGAILTASASAFVIGAHPYLTEYFSFRQALPTQWISLVLFAAYLHLIGHQVRGPATGRGSWIWPAMVMLLATGAQQIVFGLAASVAIAAVAASTIRADNRASLQTALGEQWPAIKILALTALAYIIVFVAIKATGAYQQDPRSALVAPGDLSERLREVAQLVFSILFRPEPLVPTGGKIALWVCMTWLLMSAWPSMARAAAGGVTTLVACLGLSVLLVGLSGVWWPAPRAVYGVGFAFGLTIAVLGVASRRPNAAWIPAIIFGFVLALQSSAMLFEQQRLNRWDMNRALL
jgi:hypothetical protein